MGISVNASTSEASRAKVTVSAWSRGKNTATVVMVEASTAPPISRVPCRAASASDVRGSLRCRAMFSSTTMALSISMPTANAIPPRLMMFNVMSKTSISTNVASTETGMVAVTISVLRTCFRKR